MNPTPLDFGEYDHIVIGGGTAGCLLANRLSADPARRVLLLEAGGHARSRWIDMPLGILKILGNARYDWAYATEPEPALGGRRIPVPRGKGLGGSSLINGMVYVRGQARDYDDWRAQGNPGWGWDEVLPWFKRVEDHARGADAWHGAGGEWRVEDPRVRWEILEAFGAAAAEAGIAASADFNRGDNAGAGYFQYSMRRGMRLSTARAFLEPALGRANLRVATGALVQRIGLAGRRAERVQWLADGSLFEARARAGIVLAAGAIASPQLLQVSGIGPGALLQSLGVGVLHDLPGVGANLQDHYQVRAMLRIRGTPTMNQRLGSPWARAVSALQYLATRGGPLSTGAAQYCAFARSDAAQETPNLQFHVVPASYDSLGSGLHRHGGLIATVCNLRPASRGSVRITSPDMAAAPAIVQNFLADAADCRVAVQGLRLTRRIFAGRALARFAPQELTPGAAVDGDEALLDYSRRTGMSVFHPVGTCKMGRDADAVVDADLRVHGLQGLRVVDASIMPTLVSGNTSAPVLMIAEKAAASILGTG